MGGTDSRGCSGSSGRPPSVGGRLGLSLFFLFFFALGSVFGLFVVCEFGRALSQRLWKKTPCMIVSSEVREQHAAGSPFAFVVSYRYEQAGRSYAGSVYKRNYSKSDTYSDAQTLAQEYPAGSSTLCHVNPRNPGEAVLRRDSLTIGLFVLVPLIFLALGAGGLYGTWTRRASTSPQALATTAIHTGGRKKYALAGLLGVFALAGGAMLYPLGLRPIAETLDAQSWVATPCRVLRAEVRSHDSDDGTTYSVYILYEYKIDGQTYKSDRYSFVGGSSSGCRGKARVVEQYRTAAHPICYVDPHHPARAVLRRGFHAGLLIVLVPLAFLLVGVGGAYGVLKHRGPAAVPSVSVLRAGNGGPVVLRPRHSPLAKLAGAVLIAVFSNLINVLMLAKVADDLRQGHRNGPLLLLLVLFGAFGIGTLALVVYQFLAAFNPRATLELSSSVIPLGATAELIWSLRGRTTRIREFAVTLRGIEETRYQKGTHTYTDRNTFYELELYRTSDPHEIAAGQVGFVLPQDTMHSFEAENNKILWNLDIHGSIKHWPDVKESFKLTVTPTAA